MTTRQLLISFSALLAAASFADQASAGEPALLAVPAAAIAEFDLEQTSLTPTKAELKRIVNELRYDLHGALQTSLDQSIQSALDNSRVIAD